jgi:hypothetical protein
LGLCGLKISGFIEKLIKHELSNCCNGTTQYTTKEKTILFLWSFGHKFCAIFAPTASKKPALVAEIAGFLIGDFLMS